MERLLIVSEMLDERGEERLAELLYREAATKGLERVRKKIKVLHMMYQKAKKRAVKMPDGAQKKKMLEKAKDFITSMKKQVVRARKLAKSVNFDKSPTGKRFRHKVKEISKKQQGSSKKVLKKLDEAGDAAEERYKKLKKKLDGMDSGKAKNKVKENAQDVKKKLEDIRKKMNDPDHVWEF